MKNIGIYNGARTTLFEYLKKSKHTTKEYKIVDCGNDVSVSFTKKREYIKIKKSIEDILKHIQLPFVKADFILTYGEMGYQFTVHTCLDDINELNAYIERVNIELEGNNIYDENEKSLKKFEDDIRDFFDNEFNISFDDYIYGLEAIVPAPINLIQLKGEILSIFAQNTLSNKRFMAGTLNGRFQSIYTYLLYVEQILQYYKKTNLYDPIYLKLTNKLNVILFRLIMFSIG
jgi:hypothetical protein